MKTLSSLGLLSLTALCAALLATTPSRVEAQAIDTYGFGSRSIALGGAVTADVSDYSANFYNPAGLALHGTTQIAAGWRGAYNDMRLNGVDSNVDPVTGETIGLVVPGDIGDFRFAFGIGLHLNDQRISRSRSLPRQRPRWEFYDNRPHRIFVAPHLAIQPFEWLRIGGGIGFQSFTATDLTIRGTISVLNPERDSRLQSDLLGELTTIRFPQMGVQVSPLDWLRFGVVYRGEYALSNDLLARVGRDNPSVDDPNGANIVVGDIVVPAFFDLETSSVNAFVPHQISIGGSVSPIPELRINAEVTWLNWARYQSPLGTTRAVLDIDVPPELEDQITVPDEIPSTDPVPANFRDRWVPRLGVEIIPVTHPDYQMFIRAGYFYELTPIPEQTGFTNLIDTDRHAWSLGYGVDFTSLAPLIAGALSLNFYVRYAWLPARTNTKESPIDPIGDYTAEGHIFDGGFDLSVRF